MVGKLSKYSWFGAAVAIMLPMAGSVVLSLLLPPQSWINMPLHSVLECMGGVLAMTVGAILIARNSQPQATATDIWLACGLFAMGTIDLFHAATAPGPLFVWLHTVATVCGGVLMSLVWISSLVGVPRVSRTWPWYALLAAVVFGVVSCGLPDRVPTMVVDGRFTALPRYLHLLGGVGFFVAAAVFIGRFCRSLDLENWLFAVNTQLFGFAAVMFDWSTVWDGGWWWWHVMRLLAYGILAVFAVAAFLKSEHQLRVLNHQLLDWNTELDGTLAERTAALKASEVRFRHLVESSPTGQLVVERSGKIVLTNSEARRLFGYAPGELEGLPIEVLVPAATRDAHVAMREGFFMQPGARLMGAGRDLQAVRKDGSAFPVEIALSVVETATGLAALCGVADLTLRQRTLEALETARDAAESANHAKSDFLANMSHEIRTPMHHVIGLTEFVLGTQLTSLQRDYLTLVLDSAESLMTIINEILDFSKIEAGQLHLEETEFAIRDALGDTMKALAHRAHGKGLELTYHIEDDVPNYLVGDQIRLRQILLNLVGNAIVFTERGEVGVVIRQVERRDDSILLEGSVVDTGIGIAPEKLEIIFQAFAQADTSTTRRFGGTGLGLSICRRLVDLMQGRLWAESQVGKGSVFRFTCRMRLGEIRAAAEPPRHWHSLPVLVVDDNATNRLILDAMLRKWQMLPTLVASAQEALETVAASHAQGREFGLVISDVGMPEMDGFAFCERLRQQPQTADLAIILLTSYDRMGETSHDAQLGVAAHLVKPIKESELLRALQCAMTHSSAPTSCPATPAAPVTAPTAASPVPCLKVLVVDDGVTNQTLAAGILKKWGHKVHVANNGREAVEAFEADHFDLILMDIQMPEMDGLEATTAIRRREESTGRHVHIVALTAHALKGDEQMCLEAGMDHFLSKPLRQTQLLDVVIGISASLQGNRPADVKTS